LKHLQKSNLLIFCERFKNDYFTHKDGDSIENRTKFIDIANCCTLNIHTVREWIG
jgi:hypothetical protein